MQEHIPVDVRQSLYTAVGCFVVNWALVEAAVTYCVTIIYQSAEGHGQEPQVPNAFGRKCKFLHKCFKRIDALHPFTDEGNDLIEQAEQLSEPRHNIIHGTLSGYDPGSDAFKFVRFNVTKDKKFHQSNETITPGMEILTNGLACEALASKILKFAHRLAEAFIPEDDLDDLPRGI